MAEPIITINTEVTIDTAAIGSLYDILLGKGQASVNAMIEKNSIKGADAANIISSMIGKVIDTSVNTVQNAPILVAQRAMIFAQLETENARKLLTDRQKAFYDDQLKMEETKGLSQITMGFAMAGTTLPNGLLTQTLNAIYALTHTDTNPNTTTTP